MGEYVGQHVKSTTGFVLKSLFPQKQYAKMEVVVAAAAAALRSLVTVLGQVPRVVDIPTQLAWSRRRAQVRIERERKIPDLKIGFRSS